MVADWEATQQKAIAYLKRELRPVHYRELCRQSLVGGVEDYGPNTDHEEKFRQRYGCEHWHSEMFITPKGSGNVALRRWFPIGHTRQLVAPEPLEIKGKHLASYQAGYEHGKREDYLKDWYGDGGSEQRWQRRMQAFQFESQVRSYHLANWPTLCRPPSNHHQWSQPADNDFLISLPEGNLYKIDMKSASYSENGANQYKVRRLYRDVIYIAGEWDAVHEVAVVKGIVSGRWLRDTAGYGDGDFFADGDLVSFEVLPVMLNMASCGMSWSKAMQWAIQSDRSTRTT